jgi:hypothetical protein
MIRRGRACPTSPPPLAGGGGRELPLPGRPPEENQRDEMRCCASSQADRALLERAAGCQSADRANSYVEGPSHIALCLTCSEALKRLLPLMGCQLERTAKPHTTILSALAAFTSSCADQLALELGQAAKHREHQAPVRRGGVRPGILERTKARATLADLI